MSKYTQVDLWFTEEGDLAIDNNGDLKDTLNSYGRAVLQEIRDRLHNRPGEWKLNSSIGSNLERFLGEAGTTGTIGRVVNEIVQALTFDRLLIPGEFEVIPLQFIDSILMFRIIISTKEGELSTSFGYDSDQSRFIGYNNG